jgi:hypothetical protein
MLYTSPGRVGPEAGVTTSIAASNKTLASSMMSSFTSEYLTCRNTLRGCFSEIALHFLSICPVLQLIIILGHYFEALAYQLALLM